jgi:hypothetical protein
MDFPWSSPLERLGPFPPDFPLPFPACIRISNVFDVRNGLLVVVHDEDKNQWR